MPIEKFLCVFILSVINKSLTRIPLNLVSHRLYIHTDVDFKCYVRWRYNDFRGRAPSSVFSSSTTRINAILAITCDKLVLRSWLRWCWVKKQPNTKIRPLNYLLRWMFSALCFSWWKMLSNRGDNAGFLYTEIEKSAKLRKYQVKFNHSHTHTHTHIQLLVPSDR